MYKDKKTECTRYDTRAKALLSRGPSSFEMDPNVGSLSIPPTYRSPYIFYEQCISQYISKEHVVLELCSGTGLHTRALSYTGAQVVASDISAHSMSVLTERVSGVTSLVTDIESLPFGSDSFDVIAIAGSLSYGEPDLVDAEIKRVLRPGGIFLCVDSLNHNPIYRLNRWVNYLRGNRTQSTLLRMPTMGRIRSIASNFKGAEIRFFGSVSYLMPLMARVLGQNRAAQFSDAIDRCFRIQRTAFKFVLIAQGRL